MLGILPPWVKRPGHEADHSPLSSAEVKNAWRYTSTLPVHFHGMVLNKAMDVFIAWYLVKHMFSFTFTSDS
jgi:hypothetical protein